MQKNKGEDRRGTFWLKLGGGEGLVEKYWGGVGVGGRRGAGRGWGVGGGGVGLHDVSAAVVNLTLPYLHRHQV